MRLIGLDFLPEPFLLGRMHHLRLHSVIAAFGFCSCSCLFLLRMSGKSRPTNDLSSLGGLVYSTDPNALAAAAEATRQPQAEALPPAKQDLRVTLDKRLKGGKQATVIYQFVGPDDALEVLGKRLKTVCGVGGSVKNGEIILQGNCLDKVQQELKRQGYRYKLAGV